MTRFDLQLPADIGKPRDPERARLIAGVSVGGALLVLTGTLLAIAMLMH